jgi:large subunit ribosomal protein L24
MKSRDAHVRAGDLVMVTAGRERGNRGKVLQIVRKKGRVVVEKLHMVKRHMKASAAGQAGSVVEKEGTVHLSNVLLVCPACDRATRTRSSANADGSKGRVCVKCSASIPGSLGNK